ncbi:hypothetical protein ABZT47_39865 [Sphaerisporangium sp. NPDC005289]
MSDGYLWLAGAAGRAPGGADGRVRSPRGAVVRACSPVWTAPGPGAAP